VVRLAPSTIASALLLVSAAALGAHLVISPPDASVESGVVAGASIPDPPAELETENAFAIPGPGPLTEFAEITDRPLFSPSRRPPVRERKAAPKPVVAAAPTPKRIDTGQYQLLGVVIEDERRVALLRSLRTRTIEVVSEGETLDAWTVAKIGAESITLVQGNVRDVVSFRETEMTESDKRALGKVMRKGRSTDKQSVRPRRGSSAKAPKLQPRILSPSGDRKSTRSPTTR